MTDIVIPDDAVEAAAKAHYEAEHSLTGWDGTWLSEANRESLRSRMRTALEAALPALRTWRVEISTVYGYELGRSDIADEIAEVIRKRRDMCPVGSAAWSNYNEAVEMALRIGAKP